MEVLKMQVKLERFNQQSRRQRGRLRGLMMSWPPGVSIGMHGLLLAGFALFQFILSPHQYKFMTDLTGGGERKSLSKSMCG
jgi:hypothetical protein